MFKTIINTCVSALLMSNAIAGEMGVTVPDLTQDWAAVITLSGGPAWTAPGTNQYIHSYLTAKNDYFVADKKTSALGVGEIYVGLQHLLLPTTLGQLGIGVAAASNLRLSGIINSDGTVAVNTYSYRVNHVRAEFKGKLIAAGCRWLQPYLSTSLGVGFNHAHDYQATTIDKQLYPATEYKSHSTVVFSYSLGAGVQKTLSTNWQVGVGYEFADWGRNELGDTNMPQGPRLGHVYTNELLFSLSYLF